MHTATAYSIYMATINSLRIYSYWVPYQPICLEWKRFINTSSHTYVLHFNHINIRHMNEGNEMLNSCINAYNYVLFKRIGLYSMHVVLGACHIYLLSIHIHNLQYNFMHYHLWWLMYTIMVFQHVRVKCLKSSMQHTFLNRPPLQKVHQVFHRHAWPKNGENLLKKKPTIWACFLWKANLLYDPLKVYLFLAPQILLESYKPRSPLQTIIRPILNCCWTINLSLIGKDIGAYADHHDIYRARFLIYKNNLALIY